MQAQELADATEQTSDHVHLSPDQAEATQFTPGQRVPLTMPSGQTYYWRHEWQKDERESLAALEAGDAIVFDSDDPEDIVRWLHAPDEPDAD